MINNEDFDIMGNMRLLENYKAFLLASVSDFFTTMAKGNNASIVEVRDELSEIIILSYLLGGKLGINYDALDESIIRKLKLGAVEDYNIDKEYQEYSKLISYIKDVRQI